MILSPEISFKEEIWNYWCDPVYAMHKASAPLHESPKKNCCVFFLFDQAGPIIVNTLGQKTLESLYFEPLEGQLEVNVDHCRLKLTSVA